MGLRFRMVRDGWEDEPLREIAARYAGQPDAAVEALREARCAGLPLNTKVVETLAKALGRRPASLWGVATFYDEFREQPVAPQPIKTTKELLPQRRMRVL